MKLGRADDHVVELAPQLRNVRRPQMLFESGEAFPTLIGNEAALVPGFPIQLEGKGAILPQRQLTRPGEGGLGTFMLALADAKSNQEGEW